MVMCYNYLITIGGFLFMAIIFQHDKRTGITYAYDSKSYYDREKKCSRAKRTLIGRVDPETNEIIPTDGRNRGAKSKKEVTSVSASDKDARIHELENLVRQLELQVTALRRELDRVNSKRQ